MYEEELIAGVIIHDATGEDDLADVATDESIVAGTVHGTITVGSG